MINFNNTNDTAAVKLIKVSLQQHPFHLVDPSPWPFLVSFSLFGILFNTVCYLHELAFSTLWFFIYISTFFFAVTNWFYDIIVEATYQGHHTMAVQQGLRYGMVLFIVSEVMFFFAFFWAFFYSSISPSIALGCVWPPLGIEPLNPWGLPFLNTLILLSSGVSVTWAHRAVAYQNVDYGTPSDILWVDFTADPALTNAQKSIFTNNDAFSALSETAREALMDQILTQASLRYVNGVDSLTSDFINEDVNEAPDSINYRRDAIVALAVTIVLGMLFTGLQLFEYQTAPFTIADGIYGSTFFVTTGFHGLHVIVGTIFLFVALLRHIFYHFLREQHFGLEAAIWYWHFVDVVWLFLFVSIYWWGS